MRPPQSLQPYADSLRPLCFLLLAQVVDGADADLPAVDVGREARGGVAVRLAAVPVKRLEPLLQEAGQNLVRARAAGRPLRGARRAGRGGSAARSAVLSGPLPAWLLCQHPKPCCACVHAQAPPRRTAAGLPRRTAAARPQSRTLHHTTPHHTAPAHTRAHTHTYMHTPRLPPEPLTWYSSCTLDISSSGSIIPSSPSSSPRTSAGTGGSAEGEGSGRAGG